jgi:hypothetical protein
VKRARSAVFKDIFNIIRVLISSIISNLAK